MNDFNTLFPNFASQCAALNRVLLPIAFVLLVIGIVSSTVTSQRSPGAYLRTSGRTFALLAVLSQLTVWCNQVSSVVDTTVKTTLQADPTRVFEQYKQKLEVQDGASANNSWWDMDTNLDTLRATAPQRTPAGLNKRRPNPRRCSVDAGRRAAHSQRHLSGAGLHRSGAIHPQT